MYPVSNTYVTALPLGSLVLIDMVEREISLNKISIENLNFS